MLKSNKIILKENTDSRKINNNEVMSYNFATIDISFISVLKKLPKIEKLSNLEEIVFLIKPQIECGIEIV